VEESGEERGSWLGGREGEEEEIKRGKVVGVKLYRSALLRRREGEVEQSQGRAQVNGQHRRALRVRGGRSAPVARCGRTKGGQRRRCGRWERQQGDTWARGGQRRPAAAREAAGGGGSRARSRDRGDRGPEEEDEDQFAKPQKYRDPTVMP
jgi:hypothetical protein